MQGMLNLAAKQHMVTISLQAVKDQAGVASNLALVAATLHRLSVDHPDRLFDVRPVPGHLTATQAAAAIIEPAAARGVVWLFAHKTWQVAPGPVRITLADAQQGILLGAADGSTNRQAPHPGLFSTPSPNSGQAWGADEPRPDGRG